MERAKSLRKLKSSEQIVRGSRAATSLSETLQRMRIGASNPSMRMLRKRQGKLGESGRRREERPFDEFEAFLEIKAFDHNAKAEEVALLELRLIRKE